MCGQFLIFQQLVKKQIAIDQEVHLASLPLIFNVYLKIALRECTKEMRIYGNYDKQQTSKQ